MKDRYLYHIVTKFELDIKIDELFYSINFELWTGNKYDVYYYNSHHFINIFLNKYNQRLILMKNSKIYNTVYTHLCRECYKKFNNPECYVSLEQGLWKFFQKKMINLMML